MSTEEKCKHDHTVIEGCEDCEAEDQDQKFEAQRDNQTNHDGSPWNR